MKKMIQMFLIALVAVKAYGQGHDTFSVHFELNNTQIGKRASDFIDRLIFKDVLIHGQKLIVLGYADYLGSDGHNDSLSAMRAKNVKDYLVNAGFDTKDITLCMGKGKIERGLAGKEGFAKDRKVQIIIDHNLPATPPKAVVKAPAKMPVKAPAEPQYPAAAVMDIAKVKVNEAIKLQHIFFEGGSPVILPNSLPELEKLLQVLTDNPTLKIRIEGHVCCVGPIEGSDEGNLSVRRAEAIYNYLTSKGISGDRLEYAGLGNRNPVVREEVSEEDRVQNRRVEIRILSK